MPLSNKLRRVALLMEPDVQRTLERQAQRVAGHDAARFDDRTGTVVFTRHGGVLWQPRAERIADWVPDLGMFYWWWHGAKFAEFPRSKLDVIYREGQNYALSELTTDSVGAESLEDAELLTHLALQLLRADGLYRSRAVDRVSWFALFGGGASEAPRMVSDGSSLRDTNITSASQRPAWLTTDPHETGVGIGPSFVPAAVGAPKTAWSVAPPPRNPSGERAALLGVRTMPPLDLSPEPMLDAIPKAPRAPTPPPPQVNLPIREPAREIFMPVAQTALADIATTVPQFAQALVVVRVEAVQPGKHRFFVQLVALDGGGDLISLDPSRALLDAATKMISDDARDGNGRWHKLAARLRPTARGASVDVEVA
ncbi:MAG: hypothetical protein HYV09_01460 [Deltaproteobacteria bacterium]|nr:hypothetical protein [Deltaproteobacteria bacterium]